MIDAGLSEQAAINKDPFDWGQACKLMGCK